MIPFNKPTYTGNELLYVEEAIISGHIGDNGPFTFKCEKWMEDRFQAGKVLLTSSGSAALDIAALLCDLQNGDEVIMPSFTFTSTANSFINYGAVPVFVDIRPDTMNIDEEKIEAAITNKTRAIVVMHYAGVSCEMQKIRQIADQYGLIVIEDAAQGMMSEYKGAALGTIGDIGCHSFHESKNYSMGEGGALVINNWDFLDRAEIIREKGTNRHLYLKGEINKYTWVGKGDSFIPSDMNAAYLWAQLEKADEIFDDRMRTWVRYYDAFSKGSKEDRYAVPSVPHGCNHNAHIFYLKCRDEEERDSYIEYMKSHDIVCTFHYVPLHTTQPGLKYCRFAGEDINTSKESSRLVRLPIYYGMSDEDRETVINRTFDFYNS